MRKHLRSPNLQPGEEPITVRCYAIPESLRFAKGGLVKHADAVRRAGRGGDDVLLHLNAVEFKALKDKWGEPTINPQTGLPEYSWYGDLWDYITNSSGDHPIASALTDAALGAGAAALTGGNVGEGALIGGGLSAATSLLAPGVTKDANGNTISAGLGGIWDRFSNLDTKGKITALTGLANALHKNKSGPPAGFGAYQDPTMTQHLTPLQSNRTQAPPMDPKAYWTYGQTTSDNPGEARFFSNGNSFTPYQKPPGFASGGAVLPENYLAGQNWDHGPLFGGSVGSATPAIDLSGSPVAYTPPPNSGWQMTVAPPGTSDGSGGSAGGTGGGSGGGLNASNAATLAKLGVKAYNALNGSGALPTATITGPAADAMSALAESSGALSPAAAAAASTDSAIAAGAAGDGSFLTGVDTGIGTIGEGGGAAAGGGGAAASGTGIGGTSGVGAAAVPAAIFAAYLGAMNQIDKHQRGSMNAQYWIDLENNMKNDPAMLQGRANKYNIPTDLTNPANPFNQQLQYEYANGLATGWSDMSLKDWEHVRDLMQQYGIKPVENYKSPGMDSPGMHQGPVYRQQAARGGLMQARRYAVGGQVRPLFGAPNRMQGALSRPLPGLNIPAPARPGVPQGSPMPPQPGLAVPSPAQAVNMPPGMQVPAAPVGVAAPPRMPETFTLPPQGALQQAAPPRPMAGPRVPMLGMGSIGGRPAMASGGKVAGPGTGRSDEIPARLSDGEYVMDAETVALLGDGSTQAGAAKLDAMRRKLRAHKGKALAKGKISPDAKDPMTYLGAS